MHATCLSTARCTAAANVPQGAMADDHSALCLACVCTVHLLTTAASTVAGAANAVSAITHTGCIGCVMMMRCESWQPAEHESSQASQLPAFLR